MLENPIPSCLSSWTGCRSRWQNEVSGTLLPAYVNLSLLPLAHCQDLTFFVAASQHSLCLAVSPFALVCDPLGAVGGRGLVDAARDKFEPLEAAVLAETSEEVLERVHGLFG